MPASPLGNGTITARDAASGRILYTALLDGDPSAVAVDARYGRVVVTNMGAIDSMSNYDGAGRMTELDERTGMTLRSVAVGVAGSISPLTNVPVMWSRSAWAGR